MNLRTWVRWVLFLSSYAPLFLILLLRSWDTNYLRWVFGVLVVVPVAIALATLHLSGKLEPFELNKVIVRDKASEGAVYFASYVVSFIPDTDPGAKDLLALAVLLLVLGAVYVSSGLIYLNPTLSLLGWHISDVRGVPAGAGTTRRAFVVFSRTPLESHKTIRICEISSSVARAVT